MVDEKGALLRLFRRMLAYFYQRLYHPVEGIYFIIPHNKAERELLIFCNKHIFPFFGQFARFCTLTHDLLHGFAQNYRNYWEILGKNIHWALAVQAPGCSGVIPFRKGTGIHPSYR
jgi:hypothetical protein